MAPPVEKYSRVLSAADDLHTDRILVFLLPVDADAKAILFMTTLKLRTCCWVIPDSLITGHSGAEESVMGETLQLYCTTAAVGQRLVTVSDKYRGLWSSPLQLYLRPLLGARERPHRLGAATILIHPR